MKRFNGFKVGSGCFTCRDCKKQTRDVNGTNGALKLCPLCLAKAECGNQLSDNGFRGNAWAQFDDCQSPAECEQKLERLMGALEKASA